MILQIQLLFSIILLGCSIFVCFSRNPIDSILFLILAFCNAAALFLIFKAELLGLLLIIVYVGAVAILFLFLVMMLDIKQKEARHFIFLNKKTTFLLALAILSCFATTSFIVLRDMGLFELNNSFIGFTERGAFFYDSFHNIEILGQLLYGYFVSGILIAGLILLIALIGAVVLTFNFNTNVNSHLFLKQLSRSENTLSFFKAQRSN